MASMIFSDDEAKYLRAVLKWQEKPPDDRRASWLLGLRMPEKKPVGEFRVLVIGARGVGKTSILKKFCTGVFPDPSSLAASGNINGCRRNITIESNADGKHVNESNLYTVDALELPVEHLSSPDHLTQALAITDAAVLVYDITEPASLTYLKSLANNIYSSIHPGKTVITPTKKKGGFHLPGSPTRRDTCDATHNSKPYHFLLIGAKRDVPDQLREVSWLEGQIAAEEFFGPSGIAAGASVGFMEVSARTGEQVGAIFPSLGREVLKSRRERQASSSQKYLLSAQGSGGLSGWDISDFDDHDMDDADDDGKTDGSGTMAGSVRPKNKRKNTKDTGEPCHSQALVKQLKDLCLDDDDVLEQILTSAEPEALNELTAAHNGKSVIPLFTEKDGREFFILAGSPAYSNWDGQYPMEFSPTIKYTRKLSDPTLADEKITTYQNDALKEILTAVYATEDAAEFPKPVMVYRPQIWDNYKALIAEPIDLETMGLMLYHNRYATVWGFKRHADLLEENARKYNGNRNPSIVAAAIKVRGDIYRRMDEVPAEPPLGHHGVSMARRIIYADEHGSARSADGSVVGASPERADKAKAGARHTDCPTFFLPLGRLGVARNSGDEEIIPTPYIVVMSLESSDKPLWLYKDNYTPVGLPSDKKALLDFGGQYNFTIAKLVDGINEWEPLSGRGCRGSKGNKVPALCWEKVKNLIRKTSQDKAVLFDVVEDRQQAKTAIEEGWGTSPESSEPSESEQLNGFVVGDSASGDSDSDHNDPAAAWCGERRRRRRGVVSYTEHCSDSDDSEPPRKRRRPAI